jgi:hypothetical protein
VIQAAAPPVFVVVMENHGYDSIVGNADAHWINAALKKYGVALNYRAVAHPSQPNYIAMTSGSTQGVTGDGDVKVSAPNLGTQLTAHGKTWRAYMQGYASCADPYASFCDSGRYARKHNPFASYGEATNVGDISELGHGKPPDFGFVVPDQCHDMHGAAGCGDLVRTGDGFLASTVAKIRRWARRALIFVTWDEAERGSNHVLTLVIGGTKAKSTRAYDHYSLLRTIEDRFGLGCLGRACGAPPMADLSP